MWGGDVLEYISSLPVWGGDVRGINMLFDAISCLVWMNTTIIILLQVSASRDSMKFAPKIGMASMTISACSHCNNHRVE